MEHGVRQIHCAVAQIGLVDHGCIDRSDCEWNAYRVSNGSAFPCEPGECCFSSSGFPEIGCDGNVELAGCAVVERQDDHRLVNVLDHMMQVFPTTVVLYAGPARRLPDIIQLPIKCSKLAPGLTGAPSVEFNVGFDEVGLENLRRLTPSREVGQRA